MVALEGEMAGLDRQKDFDYFIRNEQGIWHTLVLESAVRQALGRVVELGPGSILQFDKSCEEMLELHIGGQPVALGEAVKVGDKFGIRLSAVTMPGERFKPVRATPAAPG